EPAGQCQGRRDASPFGEHRDCVPAAPGERDDTSGGGAGIRRYRDGSRDDPLKTVRCLFAAGERASRPHIRRGLRICREQGVDPFVFLDIEPVVGISGKVEKARRIVLGGVHDAAPLPQAAIGRVRSVFWFLASHHRNFIFPGLRGGPPEHPRNRCVHWTSARKWARSFTIALWWALRTVWGSIPRARAISETSISRSYNIVKISRCLGDSKASGS